MLQQITERMGCRCCVVVFSMGVGVASLLGCAADAPKPSPTMTQDQVKSNADKSFERLKQEEKNRTTDSGTAPY